MTDLADLSFFLSVLWQQSTGEEKSKKRQENTYMRAKPFLEQFCHASSSLDEKAASQSPHKHHT
jgi:hypothetical protein